MGKSLYLSKIQLREELKRCLNCRAQPCMNACPVNCNPREFIRCALQDEWDEAVSVITRTNPMGQTCGLICPDKFCMKACTRNNIDFPINIPRVQATILNSCRTEREALLEVEPNGKRVAVIGAGPAGLAAMACLAKRGYGVTIFEARGEIGGALNMIPRERLPHEVIERDFGFIRDERFVELNLNMRIEDPRELCERFDAVIVATGEPNCMSLQIPGEALSISYMDYLYNPEKYITQGHVAVIGGGNVAADCALTAVRQGAVSVEMFIRRRIADMRVSKQEYMELIAQQVNLNGMTSPEKLERRNDKICLSVRKNYYDGTGWAPLPNSTIELPYFDLVIRAIGSRADTKLDDNDKIIYAGDCKTGGSTIVEALSSGKSAAEAMMEFLDRS